MYKKITHSIVEEHFGHPDAVNLNQLEGVKPKLIQPITPDDFRAQIEDFMTKYIGTVNKIINSVTGTEAEMAAAETTAFQNINFIGDTLREVYPVQFRETINQDMRAGLLALIQTIHLLRSGLDTRDWVNGRFNGLISNELAQTMSTINNLWNYVAVRDLYNNMTLAWVAQAKARQAKNFNLEQQQASKSLDSARQFARLFSDGVIAQHPELFGLPATLSAKSDKDIM
jgi:hypothetical protein